MNFLINSIKKWAERFKTVLLFWVIFSMLSNVIIIIVIQVLLLDVNMSHWALLRGPFSPIVSD